MISQIIGTTANKLIDFELNNRYKILGKALDIDDEWFGDALYQLFEKSKVITHFYTTNYDGILDIMLMRNNGRYLSDGFEAYNKVEIKFDSEDAWNACKFNLSNFLKSHKNDNIIAHLHGSYKFINTKSGKTRKLIKTKDGNHPIGYYPVIVYNSPILKYDLIEQIDVLKWYFLHFRLSLGECSKLVIWGNSLRTDPHIVDAICQNFDKEKPLYIIDINPKSVIERLQNTCKNKGFDKFKNIKTINNLGFDEPPKTKKDLFELFKKLITD
ncbi:hypothetical protein Mjas_07345 [Methanothermococcus sp. Ax23]|uniref:hypothetical protein n=1 Tax=Methanothermococcus sp. Ax23 TaxID=3156486 RepID=UPI003B9E7219